jgi:hypothetical protein
LIVVVVENCWATIAVNGSSTNSFTVIKTLDTSFSLQKKDVGAPKSLDQNFSSPTDLPKRPLGRTVHALAA